MSFTVLSDTLHRGDNNADGLCPNQKERVWSTQICSSGKRKRIEGVWGELLAAISGQSVLLCILGFELQFWIFSGCLWVTASQNQEPLILICHRKKQTVSSLYSVIQLRFDLECSYLVEKRVLQCTVFARVFIVIMLPIIQKPGKKYPWVAEINQKSSLLVLIDRPCLVIK